MVKNPPPDLRPAPTLVVAQSDHGCGARSQRWPFNFCNKVESNGPASLIARFCSTWSAFRIPAIVVLTAGLERIKRKASDGRLIPAGRAVFSFSIRSTVFAKFSGPKYLARQSFHANFVS